MDKDLVSLILTGLSFFVVGMLVAAAVSGKKLLTVLRNNSKVVVVLLVLAITIPTTVGLSLKQTTFNSQATTTPQITGINTNMISTGDYKVTITTDIPSLAYLQYLDTQSGKTITVNRASPTQKQTVHEFFLEDITSVEITFFLNGELYLYNNQTYKIP